MFHKDILFFYQKHRPVPIHVLGEGGIIVHAYLKISSFLSPSVGFKLWYVQGGQYSYSTNKEK